MDALQVNPVRRGIPRAAVKALTDGKGPDVIYDPVGGDFAEPAFRSIAWRGRYLVVGFAAGPIPHSHGIWRCSKVPPSSACSGATSPSASPKPTQP